VYSSLYVCVRVSMVSSITSTTSSSYSSQVSDGGGSSAAMSLSRPEHVRRTEVYGKAQALYSFHADVNNSRYCRVSVCLSVCFIIAHVSYGNV